jgi:hypothetical protein
MAQPCSDATVVGEVYDMSWIAFAPFGTVGEVWQSALGNIAFTSNVDPATGNKTAIVNQTLNVRGMPASSVTLTYNYVVYTDCRIVIFVPGVEMYQGVITQNSKIIPSADIVDANQQFAAWGVLRPR